MRHMKSSARRHRAANDYQTPPGGASNASLAVAALPSATPAAARNRSVAEATVPDYLRDTYTWAYLRPESVWLLDRDSVVNAILWGNYRRLLRAALAELRPGQRVYQPACVYGDVSS